MAAKPVQGGDTPGYSAQRAGLPCGDTICGEECLADAESVHKIGKIFDSAAIMSQDINDEWHTGNSNRCLRLVEAAKNPIGLAALMVVVLAPFLWTEIETWQTASVLGALILLVGWVSWL